MTDWQLIDTAPKDGTPILATSATYQYTLGRCAVVFWDDDAGVERGWHLPSDAPGYPASVSLTHWMHLPAPPITLPASSSSPSDT